MRRVNIASAGYVPAPSAEVYALLADYRNGHPRILPEEFFAGLEVEEGGVGAGTRIRVGVRVFGSVQTLRLEVSEPEPGRVLAERDVASGAVTSFTVDPDGRGSRVTIAVDWQPRGVVGWVQSRFLPGYLRRLYPAELAKLARVMG